MKKQLIGLAALLFLAGCQEEDNRFLTYTMPPTIEQEEEIVETARPSVIVYGIESVTNGFIIKVDERDKWLVTVASAVSHHPNALIETSEGQLLRANVEAIDTEHNIAILKFRNSAHIEPFTLAIEPDETVGKVGVANLTDTLELKNITSVVQQGGQEALIIVPPKTIGALLETSLEEPLTWEKRAELSQSLQSLSPIGAERVNKVDTYEKETFLYNSDDLMLTVQQFHEQLTSYMKTKDRALIEPFIYSDDLLQKLEKVEDTAELTPLTIKSVTRADTLYEVSGEMEESTDKLKKKYTITYQLIKHNENWYVIALKFS